MRKLLSTLCVFQFYTEYLTSFPLFLFEWYWALGANPGSRIEETHQGKSSATIRKLFVAIMLADFLSVILLGLDSFGVPHDALWVSNVQLGSHVRNNSHRNIDRISEKGSQEPERSNLNPKAQTIVLSTTLGNKQTIFVVQMKIASELFWGWFANIASIALFLFFGEILNGHPIAPPLVPLPHILSFI